MKNILKYFIIIIGICFMLPNIVDAATFTLKEREKSDGVTIYDVIYTPEDTPLTTALKIDLTKTNNDLTYKVKKNENGGAVGECNDFPCTLTLDLVKTEATIASITITNTSTDEKTTIIKLSGDVTSNEETVKVKPIKNTTTTTTTQKIKSNDATLSDITLSSGTFDKTFAKDITEYSITGIKDTVNSINITPNCDNECSWSISCPTGGCSVSNIRKVTLQNGANKVAINVVSEDETANKTYILNIYRGEIVSSSAYLEELKIKDGKLSPNFDPMNNEYSIEVGLDVKKLDIITTTEDPNADVIIKGNEKLVEGENTITITVTSSDGESKQVYTILVNKIEEEKEKVETTKKVTTTKVEKKENNTLLIVLLSLLGVGLIVVVFLIIFKNKKKKNNKNDKNDKNNGSGTKISEEKTTIEDENTETLNILKEAKDMYKEEPKDDVDSALDDLMKTKRLELGDLDF